MQKLLAVILLSITAVSLSGCIIDDHRDWHHDYERGGWHHNSWHGHY